MSESERQVIKDIRAKHNFSAGNVLEIGSLNVNGEVRDLFADATKYTGVDMCEGEGVNIKINGHDLMGEFDAGTFDTIICLNTLEHDDLFWQTLFCINSLIKKDGILIISTPTFGFPQHNHPEDYYRFGIDAYKKVIFGNYEILDLIEYSSKGNPQILGIGRKL
jgi:SAM-dependent methyltransferase